MMMELKPCPFCGKSVAESGTIADLLITDDDWDEAHYSVICNYNNGGCGMMLGYWYETEEDARNAWNRRANDEKL